MFIRQLKSLNSLITRPINNPGLQARNTRVHGLDILRAAAIILVFFYHYMWFISKEPTFGFLSHIGWVGVDLFFVLSGYLIGHQVFLPIANQQKFSLKIFYSRRLLRTLPPYLFVLGIYFLIPGFKENEVLPSFWKFLTFTQNFGLQQGTAFSQAWSLCVEEQFYLIFPLIALIIPCKKFPQYGWIILVGLLITAIILRCFLWFYCSQYTGQDFHRLYFTKIYYSSFCRFDELVFGIGIALLRNFHPNIWFKLTQKGNLTLFVGLISSGITFYLLYQNTHSLLMTAIGYPLLGLSFSALTIAALSPDSYLYNLKIPGATTLAAWSYAIYLIHKPIGVIIYSELSKSGFDASNLVTIFTITVGILAIGGWIHVFIESPFLKLRNKINKVRPGSNTNDAMAGVV